MRTLIIEDDTNTALLLGMMLEELGIEVCGTAATEDDAIAAALAFSPDLMIVDVNLRIGTGIGAVNEILRKRYVPHIFVSADLTPLKATCPGAIMLQKPYVYAQMAEAIHRATALAA